MSRRANRSLVCRCAASVLAALLLGGLLPLTASPSIGLSTGPVSAVTLQVDAAGDALVTWTQGGKKETVFVTAAGVLTRSGALSGPDVSRPAPAGGLPSVETARSTPGGNLWAVQLLSFGAGKTPSLDLSHWKGSPTRVTLASDGTHLTGSVSFGGKPVSGFRATPGGLEQRIYVYLDCFGCSGPGWTFMLGVAPKADGTFSVLLRTGWKGSRYRATVGGPNPGTTYAPDAQTIISA